MILNAIMLYINLYKLLSINCGVTVVEVDNNACPSRLSLMFEATYLIERPIPYISMPKVV